jgi:hypothetical protein
MICKGSKHSSSSTYTDLDRTIDSKNLYKNDTKERNNDNLSSKSGTFYICICICLNVFICMCMDMDIYIYIYIHIYIYIYIYI